MWHRMPRVELLLPEDTMCKEEELPRRAQSPSSDLLKLPAIRQQVEQQWAKARSPLPHWTIDVHVEMLAKLSRIIWLQNCPLIGQPPSCPLLHQRFGMRSLTMRLREHVSSFSSQIGVSALHKCFPHGTPLQHMQHATTR